MLGSRENLTPFEDVALEALSVYFKRGGAGGQPIREELVERAHRHLCLQSVGMGGALRDESRVARVEFIRQHWRNPGDTADRNREDGNTSFPCDDRSVALAFLQLSLPSVQRARKIKQVERVRLEGKHCHSRFQQEFDCARSDIRTNVEQQRDIFHIIFGHNAAAVVKPIKPTQCGRYGAASSSETHRKPRRSHLQRLRVVVEAAGNALVQWMFVWNGRV